MLETIAASAATALIVSMVYNRMSAVHTLEVIDGYVNAMTQIIKELIRDTTGNK